MAAEGAPSARATIWDLPTRLFHWSLPLLIAGSWWTQEEEKSELHSYFGYTILTLLLFRLAWGFVGSETSRFSSFVRGPRAAFGHLREMLSRAPLGPHVGHNPLGGYAVLLMLLSLTVQVGTGLFLYDDEFFWAPLNDYASEDTVDFLHDVHETNFKLLLGLIGMHVAAIAFYTFIKRQRLIEPMIGGTGSVPVGEAAPRIASRWLALLLLLGSAALVYALVNYA
jgi:cytochrome b